MRRITGKSEAEKGGRAISKGWDFLYPGSHLRRAQQESLGKYFQVIVFKTLRGFPKTFLS